MGWTLNIREEAAYLAMEVVGEYDFHDARDIARKIAEESRSRDKPNVLVDMTRISGKVPDLDKFDLGVCAAQYWKPPLRVAIISAAKKSDGFFENVASNRGAKVVVVPTKQKAIAWLMQVPVETTNRQHSQDV